MSYLTHRYPQIDSMDLRDAWLLAARLDRTLVNPCRAIAAPTVATPSREDLERALISLARRVAELEHEWS